MTAYSPRAQIGRGFLQQQFNDLDVYVEDQCAQNVYVHLINRALAGRKRITSVFPLGGRRQVVAACAADQGKGGRRRLYLIDGDLDLLAGRRAPRLNRLHRLATYCIENILCDSEALLDLAQEAESSTPRDVIKKRLSLEPLLDEHVRVLLPLFVAYALIHYFGIGLQTAGYHIGRLATNTNRPLTLDKRKVRGRTSELLTATKSFVTHSKYRPVRNRVVRRALGSIYQKRFISGKQMLVLLRTQLEVQCGLRDTEDSVRVRLSRTAQLANYPEFVRAVCGAAGIRVR